MVSFDENFVLTSSLGFIQCLFVYIYIYIYIYIVKKLNRRNEGD